MTTLLSVLISFVGVVLVLALAAQSLQELIKVSFAIRAHTKRQALEGLIIESARAEKHPESTGRDIAKAVVARLQQLGQRGVRSGALRLDALTEDQLSQLILAARPDLITGIKSLCQTEAAVELEKIAKRAHDWFGLSMTPVDARYRRRMRGLAVVSSAIVVIALNADAVTIWRQARLDDGFWRRADTTLIHAQTIVARFDGADSALRSDSARVRANGVRDSVIRVARLVLESTDRFPAVGISGWHYRDPVWWTGIIFSIMLVSLGAPFWHDLLESLFGIKSRIQGEAARTQQVVEAATPRTSSPSPQVAVPPPPAPSGPPSGGVGPTTGR